MGAVWDTWLVISVIFSARLFEYTVSDKSMANAYPYLSVIDVDIQTEETATVYFVEVG